MYALFGLLLPERAQAREREVLLAVFDQLDRVVHGRRERRRWRRWLALLDLFRGLAARLLLHLRAALPILLRCPDRSTLRRDRSRSLLRRARRQPTIDRCARSIAGSRGVDHRSRRPMAPHRIGEPATAATARDRVVDRGAARAAAGVRIVLDLDDLLSSSVLVVVALDQVAGHRRRATDEDHRADHERARRLRAPAVDASMHATVDVEHRRRDRSTAAASRDRLGATASAA